jgi:hypothetical protein
VEGLSDVEYGEALGVPGAGLWDPPESVHLFHLLRDDLPLLRRLLEHGIENVGRLRSLLATTAAGALLAESERTNLEWRLELVAPLLEACREGHGRPVDRDVLIAAGVSDVFLDRLADLAAELEGDGRALLDAIDARQDERVRHFHRTQRDKLERHFEDEGHLDPRSPLEPDTLVLRGLGAVAPYVARGATGPDAVRDVARSLIAAIDPSRT